MKMTRRTAMIAGGAGLTAAGVPVAQYASWASRDFSRDQSGASPEPEPGRSSWSNWSGIQHCSPTKIYSPEDESALAEFMATTDDLIRPVGSGHSFTPLVNSDGVIVDISQLQGLISNDPQAQTVTFGAGTRLRRAAQISHDLGLAFENIPDIDTQTLAGGYATATHGTGRNLPAIHADVVGFRLVTPQGEIKDVQAGADNDLLHAGQVSLGALGVISQYTLKLRPSFKLRRRVWVEKLDSLLGRMNELARTLRNFEFFYAPHTGYAIAISHEEIDAEITEDHMPAGDNFLEDLRLLRDQFGWSRWLRRRVASVGFSEGDVENVVDVSWKLLSSARPTRFNECEYHIPEENGPAAILETISLLESRNDVFFPIEVRWVRGDNAWLSPFWHGRDISIAIHASVDEPYDYLVGDFEPMFRKHGGRPHWGKLHGLSARDFVELYPRMTDFKALQKELDPDGKMLNPHLRQILEA